MKRHLRTARLDTDDQRSALLQMRPQIVPLAANGKLAKAGLAKIALHVRGENTVRLSRIQQFLNRRDARPAPLLRRTLRATVLQEPRKKRIKDTVFVFFDIRNLDPLDRTIL